MFDVFPTAIAVLKSYLKPQELYSADGATCYDASLAVSIFKVDLARFFETAYFAPFSTDKAIYYDNVIPYFEKITKDECSLLEKVTDRHFTLVEILVTKELSFKQFTVIDFSHSLDSSRVELFKLDEILSSEKSILNVLAKDFTAGVDIYFKEFEANDCASIVEVLGNRLFSSEDESTLLGLAIKQFSLLDFANGLDLSKLNVYTFDLAHSVERYIEFSLSVIDLAEIVEIVPRRLLHDLSEHIGLDRVLIEVEQSYLKLTYFAFGTYGFVNICSLQSFKPPIQVVAKVKINTAKDHDARLDLYYPEYLQYHPADAYGSYLHANGVYYDDVFLGRFEYEFKSKDTSVSGYLSDFKSLNEYIFEITQDIDKTIYKVFDSARNELGSYELSAGHNTDLHIVIGSCNHDKLGFWQEVQYDWIFVRKKITPEPTVTIGSEEEFSHEW